MAESTAYWTGRYVSLCDRLQMKAFNSPPPLSPESTNKTTDHVLENSEKIRMSTALKELRRRCKTVEALQSFEEFEAQLLKRLGVSRQSLNRVSSFAFVEKKLRLSGSGGLKSVRHESQSPGNASTPTSQISSINAEAVITGASKFYGDGNMTKSNTTGNLASLIPTISKRQYTLPAGSVPKPSAIGAGSHRRRTSYFECSPETLAKAIKEREERAARRVAETHRRSRSQAPSFSVIKTGGHSEAQLPLPKMTVVPGEEPPGATYLKANALDEVVGSLDAAMLESGHRVPPPPISKSISPRVELVKVPGGGKEKVIKSTHKAERQISGEMVKHLFGAGFREMKKMGRRVSGISWTGSGEELPSPGNQ